MFNPFVWWSEYRLRRLQLEWEAKNAPYQTMLAAFTAQQQLLQTWLDGFKTVEVPTASVMRDTDTWAAEQDRQRGEEWSAVPDEAIHQLLRGTLDDR